MPINKVVLDKLEGMLVELSVKPVATQDQYNRLLLEAVKTLIVELKKADDTITDIEETDSESKDVINKLRDSLGKVETSSSGMTLMLSRSLIWMLGVVTITIAVLVALLTASMSTLTIYAKDAALGK